MEELIHSLKTGAMEWAMRALEKQVLVFISYTFRDMPFDFAQGWQAERWRGIGDQR